MVRRKHGNAFDDAMEPLIENGFDGMADVLRILLNEAMTVFALPARHRKRMRTTNLLIQAKREFTEKMLLNPIVRL